MRSNLAVDFENLTSGLTEGAPIFYGSDLQITSDLTVFGDPLPKFTDWALKNGASRIRQVADAAEYATADHTLVAHDFGTSVSLSELQPLRDRIGTLLERAVRLLLFVEITDYCTIEEIRRDLHSAMPDLTFRVIYPRGVNKASGLRIFTAERRRPRIFLFASSHPMAGKTESALALSQSTGIKIVHVDATVNAILRGEIAAPDDVRKRVTEMFDSSPLDHSLFAGILSLLPEMTEKEDLIFDQLMPISKQTGLMEFFHQRGFFPIFCMSRADRVQISKRVEEAEDAMRESERLRAVNEAKAEGLAADVARLTDEVVRLAAQASRLAAEAKSYKAQATMYRNSRSWKVTAPLRFLEDRVPSRLRRPNPTSS